MFNNLSSNLLDLEVQLYFVTIILSAKKEESSLKQFNK
jgi:hypothetical protein